MSFGERSRRIFIAVLAVLSLLASSVSACTCSHHEGRAQAEPSCHLHSRGEERASTTNAAPQSFDPACECVPSKPVPAVISKSAKKASQPHEQIAASPIWHISLEPVAAVASDGSIVRLDPPSFLSEYFSGLLPARAPPRL